MEANPHEAGAQPHHSVSAEEVERVEGAFQFVEVLGDLHVLVRWQPVPGGGDQIGKISCRILTEISNTCSEYQIFSMTNSLYLMKDVRHSLSINALQKSDDPGSFLLGSHCRRVFIVIEVRRWGSRLMLIIQIIGRGF